MPDAPGAHVPFPPMEAEPVTDVPEQGGWRYEPKWDGFRGVLENDGGELAHWSRNERTLLRVFPEPRPLGDLLPPHSALARAAAARRRAAVSLGARRRDRDRARRRAGLRLDADASTSGRVARAQA